MFCGGAPTIVHLLREAMSVLNPPSSLKKLWISARLKKLWISARLPFAELPSSSQQKKENGVFKLKEDIEYASMLADIIDLADTPEEISIILSSDHQKAMAITEEDAATQGTDLRYRVPKPLADHVPPT